MIYNFKTDNYKTFRVFKENILPPRAYFIPFSSAEEMKKTDIRTERYNSSLVTVLGGEWKFCYFSHVSEMPDAIDTDKYSFDTVSVPSMWQFTGYEKPYYLNTRYPFKPDPPYFPEDCAVSAYVRDVEIENISSVYYLTFLGVAGALDVFVNGKYVGYSEGSHNSAEYDISSYLVKGRNEIAVVVHKWSNGTYLECQDMFRNNGIFRDVLLTEHKGSFIYDIDIKTNFTKSGTYDLDAGLIVNLKDKSTISVTLERNGELISSGKISADSSTRIGFRDLSVCEWSAEIPNLYDLVFTLSDDSGVTEVIRKRIGFKHIEIKGDTYFFNNRKIKLLGVNHHDTDPETGYYMTVADMERDVRIFKEYNINAVRTSHYPPDPTFLDLCDEYGVYVIDEADIECHGIANLVGRRGACSDNPEWKGHYWDRVFRMYQRDRNHPSIAMWSLGNESHGISNHDYCCEELHKLSPIPVHYEAACRTKRWAYDVISEMYQHQNVVEKIGNGKGLPKKFYGKPYFLCEYAHAMGVGAGDTERYVSDFLRADNLLGGCVWEFVDHAVYHKDGDGDYKYTYGGDHNEEFHDGCFCVDGLFFPDRTPHSGALQIKNCYRPIRAKQISDDEIEFSCVNRFLGKSVTVRWQAVSVNTDSQGEFELEIKPLEKIRKKLYISEPHDALVLRYYEGGREIGSEKLEKAVTLKSYSVKSSVPEMSKSENKYVFKTETGEVIYDCSCGQIVSVKIGGREVMNRSPLSGYGFNLSVFRAPFDNDRNYHEWTRLMLITENTKLIRGSSPVKSENAYTIKNTYALSTIAVKNLLVAEVTYTIYGDGTIGVCAECVKSKKIPNCPRFGVCVELKRDFENVRYFGLGDRENLVDFKEHAMPGLYETKVEDLREKYIKPQESSMRSETRFVSFTDAEGVGLEFIAKEKPFTFGADHFTSYQCAKSMHQEDLGSFDTTVIHIDSYQLGVGSNSCGPRPDRKYVKNNLKGEKLEFIIKPV